MIPAVATALDSIVGNVVTLRNAKGAGRAYELYIMTGIAMELKQLGCTVWVQRSDGSRIAPVDSDRRFVQRGGVPTGVPGAAQGKSNGSSIVFRMPGSGREWEIWNGIKFKGRSGGDHEIDIAIVPREIGITLRSYPHGGVPGGRCQLSAKTSVRRETSMRCVLSLRECTISLFSIGTPGRFLISRIRHNVSSPALLQEAIHTIRSGSAIARLSTSWLGVQVLEQVLQQ
jgi:hypothetical protein